MIRGVRIGVVALCLALLPAVVRAGDPTIDTAVTRGLGFLKSIQREDGSWREEAGGTALAALTLLECDVPAEDPAVQKAANVVRKVCADLTKTYDLSLCIMFLDRLGDPVDAQLIESMSVRLLAGQNLQGGWGYDCPPLTAAEVQRLRDLVTRRNELRATIPAKSGRPSVDDLPKEIRDQLTQVGNQQAAGGQVPSNPNLMTNTDYSNTQFAILALWVGRRQGIPVQTALARVDAQFRASQLPDGGWPYIPNFNRGTGPYAEMMAKMAQQMGRPGGPVSTPAMTCAGLLGLALGIGNATELRAGGIGRDPSATGPRPMGEPSKDLVIKNGLVALGECLGEVDTTKLNLQNLPMLRGNRNGKGYYFLWSLERVAMVYGLDTIGNKDWYAWGSAILLANQQPDGSWVGEYSGGGVDTCFGLLFLRRANLAKDLTAALKGRIPDPGKRELAPGGVGGEAFLKQMRMKGAFEGADTASSPDPRDKPSTTAGTPKGGTPKVSAEVAKLSDSLVNAKPGETDKVLGTLRDSKGAEYTDALANAIPQLSGDTRNKARDALTDRLTRLKSDSLKEKLGDENLEVRRAAALAIAQKEDKTLVAPLIELLKDPEPPVMRAAHAALKSLTEKDFGPAAEASRAEIDKAQADWKTWWSKQGK